MPCVYVENHRVAGLEPDDPIRVSYGQPIGDMPTGKANPDKLKLHPSHGHDQTIVGGISRIGLHERREIGSLGGRRYGRCPDPQGEAISSKSTRAAVFPLFRDP